MFSHTKKISPRLVLLTFLVILQNAHARFVTPVTYGYEVRSPLNDLTDLIISAAEPRPVFLELVQRPQTLPLIAEVGAISADSASPVVSASEKVEKILLRPMAFSYNTDQVHSASSHIVNSPRERLQAVESKSRLDQQPDAVDYYKYIARLHDDDKGGANHNSQAAHTDKIHGDSRPNNRDKLQESKPAHKESHDDIRVKGRPNIYLNYSPSDFHEYKLDKHRQHQDEKEKHEEKVAKPSGFYKTHAKPEHYHEHHATHKGHDHDHLALHESKPVSESIHADHADAHSEGHEASHSSVGDTDVTQAGSNHAEEHKAEPKEEVQEASESHAGGGGGGGGGNYKKGGGREHHSEDKGEHGEHGDKGYKGEHLHEHLEKGVHDKEGHANRYEEEGGNKKGHHDDDGYYAEHGHEEKGEHGTNFKEEGEHSKGHSTQGEHNIHKKDEFEKKQEFYDESHEGGENEKHGEYFHEDNYDKGGSEKSEHHDGHRHEDHYGKEGHHGHGGHHHEDKGHKDAEGHDVHHDNVEKHGKEIDDKGEKNWHYEEGSGGNEGHGDNKGAHQTVVAVVQEGKGDSEGQGSKAEDSEGQGSKAGESKGDNYHVHESGKIHEAHGSESHDAPDHSSLRDIHNHYDGQFGHTKDKTEGDHGHDAKAHAEGQHGAGDHGPAASAYTHAGDGHIHAAYNYGGVDQEKKQSPLQAEHTHAVATHGKKTDVQGSEGSPYGRHVHANGYICPGEHAHATEESARIHTDDAHTSAAHTYLSLVDHDLAKRHLATEATANVKTKEII